MERIPVLLDTDIGSDVDDALALVYLLRQPRCALLGVTTVTGEPEKRAALADALCRASGRADVPIHVGAPASLRVGSRQPLAPQAGALGGGWEHNNFRPENTATGFLQETIRAHPHEITLVAVGPLTNVARLFSLDPETAPLLHHLVLMGGCYDGGAEGSRVEGNILGDPHAAALVLQASVPRLTALGLDVTSRCFLHTADCRRRFAALGGPFELVDAMATESYARYGGITFHDPLTAAFAFEPSLCRVTPGRVEVDLGHTETQGVTRWWDNDAGPAQFARESFPEAFFRHFFQTVGGAES